MDEQSILGLQGAVMMKKEHFESVACLVLCLSQPFTALAEPEGNLAARLTPDSIHSTPAVRLESVESVAFTPNGRCVVTVDAAGAAQLWDLSAGSAHELFPQNLWGLCDAWLSSDGHYLLKSSVDSTAILWDVATGNELRRFEKPSGKAESVDLPSAGRYMVTSSTSIVTSDLEDSLRWAFVSTVWDLSTGKEVCRFEDTSANWRGAAATISPDGHNLVTHGENHEGRLVDVATGVVLRQFKGHSGSIRSFSFSPDGRYALTASYDGTARLWDVSTGTELRRFEGHSKGVMRAIFSADGRYVVTASNDKSARLWDASSGAMVAVYQGHSGPITSVALSPDGRWLVTGSADGSAGIWNASSGKEIVRLMSSGSAAWAVAEPGGRFDAKDGGDVGLLYWVMGFKAIEASTLKKEYYEPALLAKRLGFNREPLRPVRAMTRAEMHPIAEAKLHSKNTRKRVGQSQNPKVIMNAGHSQSVVSVAFSPDGGQVLTGGGEARLWDTKSGMELRQFGRQGWEVTSIAFSPDGRTIIGGGSDGAIILWDGSTGMELRSFQVSSQKVTSVAFSPDGRAVIVGDILHTAHLCNTSTGVVLRNFKGSGLGDTHVAISRDGHYALTADNDEVAVLWDIASGLRLREFRGHQSISTGALSPDTRMVLTGGRDGIACLWDATTSTQLHRLVGHSMGINSVAFSPNGRYVVTGGDDESANLWDARSGVLLCKLPVTEAVTATRNGGKIVRQGFKMIYRAGRGMAFLKRWVGSVAFSPDSRLVLAGVSDGTARLWDIEGMEIRRFEGHRSPVKFLQFSPDDRFILMGQAGSMRLWNTATGFEVFQMEHDLGWGHSLAFSPGCKCILAGGCDGSARLLDVATGAVVRTFIHSAKPEQVQGDISPDGRYILTAGQDKRAQLWDMATGEKLLSLLDGRRGISGSVISSLAFSPDSRFVLTGHEDGKAVLWDASTGAELRVLKDQRQGSDDVVVTSLVFWPDGRYVLTGCEEGVARLWDVASGEELHKFEGHSGPVLSVAFSADGRFALTGGYDGTARLWDPASGKELCVLGGHSGRVNSVAFSSNSRYLATGSDDGSVRFWLVSTGEEEADISITPTYSGEWVAVARDGRFDTGYLEEAWNLHWVVPDDPYTPLPLEIFMRDYYEPKLLPRVLSGAKFKPIRPLAELNRVQPGVKIMKVERRPSSSEVHVTAEVTGAERIFQRNGQDTLITTGVYDLRLFRDGQLVAQWPEARETTYRTIDMTSTEELKTWREAAKIPLDRLGKATKTFTVRLPRRKDLKEVEFTAYAFNEDRAKSVTARQRYTVTEELKPVIGCAYVIAVGVSGNEDMHWRLNYASEDAKLIKRVLSGSIKRLINHDIDDVVTIPLITVPAVSDFGESEVMEEREASIVPTKENIRTILDILSGRKVKPGCLEQIPAQLRRDLHPVQPEDVVILSVSSHGVTDVNGEFYILPYDLGENSGGKITPELLKHSISSQELSLWLRGMDAGQMFLIIDACHSAAAVDVEGFKPGPMGNPGLGQLSYDKKMPILTATQATDNAWAKGYSLLSYALAKEGIGEKRLSLADAMKYAEARVPKLYEEMMGEEGKGQIPRLFEFNRQQARPQKH
jgi:WD40 repeat protein